MKAPSLTLGIEEEYQIIDPQTGELKSYITQILEDGKLILQGADQGRTAPVDGRGRHRNLQDAGRGAGTN